MLRRVLVLVLGALAIGAGTILLTYWASQQSHRLEQHLPKHKQVKGTWI